MKLLSRLFIFSLIISCSTENNELVVKSDYFQTVEIDNSTIEKIIYDPNFHNLLISKTIDTSILKPGKIAIDKVESIIGVGDKEQWNMNLGEDGGCFPYQTTYDELGLEFFYMMYENDSISTITIFNNSTVQLKSGISINNSSKDDILKIYGSPLEESTDSTYLRYDSLGINFTLINDTVFSYSVFDNSSQSKNEHSLEIYNSYYNTVTSKVIPDNLLIPEKSTLSLIKEEIGHGGGRISQGVVCGYVFAYYPTRINYDQYGVSFYSITGDNISSITLYENSKVKLISGIIPFESTKEEIENVYGTKRLFTQKSENINWKYDQLGISFNFTENNDTVQDITIFKAYEKKNIITSPDFIKKPFNPPVFR